MGGREKFINTHVKRRKGKERKVEWHTFYLSANNFTIFAQNFPSVHMSAVKF